MAVESDVRQLSSIGLYKLTQVSGAYISFKIIQGQIHTMGKINAYHHGSLRLALIQAAFQVVEKKGASTLSLRDLAQDLEVSRGAPYRHFPDKDALLAAVAVQGYGLLNDDLHVINAGSYSRYEITERLGHAFFSFAHMHPYLFQVMFDPLLLSKADEGTELGKAVEDIYTNIAELLGSSLTITDEIVKRKHLIAMWSALYGYAHLKNAHMLKPYMMSGLEQGEIEAAVIKAAFSFID